jgi:hypothetical protein
MIQSMLSFWKPSTPPGSSISWDKGSPNYRDGGRSSGAVRNRRFLGNTDASKRRTVKHGEHRLSGAGNLTAYFRHPNIMPDVELGSNHIGLMVEPQPGNPTLTVWFSQNGKR